MSQPILKMMRLPHAWERQPFRATEGSSGFDLHWADPSLDHKTIGCGEIFKARTGVAVEVPRGHEGQIRARSGLAVSGIGLANGIGTIDADFRGELVAILVNQGIGPHLIRRGDRIAQLVIVPIVIPILTMVDALSDTSRADGGLGSTGLRDAT